MSAAYFSMDRLSRLEAQSVNMALDWLASSRSRGPSECPGLPLARRVLFSCMVERALPIPLGLLGIESILLIDDEPAVLRATSRLLRQAAPDLKLLLAEGANEGLLQVEGFKPDAVLVDAYMPKMSGVEVCSQIRSSPSTAQLGVVAMTADPTPELAARFARAGAIAFLEKPVDAPALFEVLSAYSMPNSTGDQK